MSSYAEVAASAPDLSDNNQSNSNSNLNLNEAKNEASKAKDKLKKSINSNLSDDDKKKIDETKSFITKFLQSIFNKTSCVVFNIKEEMKNPVVATQTILTIGAISGGICAYHERARVRRIPDDVFNVYAAILTGAVLLDGLLFKSLYPKYKKK